MGWVKVKDRLPATAGAYLVRRRGRGRLPAWEDKCQYTPPAEITPGMIVCAARWQNARGVVITSVVEWFEEEGSEELPRCRGCKWEQTCGSGRDMDWRCMAAEERRAHGQP